MLALQLSAGLLLDRLGLPVLAMGVNEAVFVRATVVGVYDDEMSDHRLSDHSEPLFPLAGGLWFPVGVQQIVPAELTPAVLHSTLGRHSPGRKSEIRNCWPAECLEPEKGSLAEF